MRVFKSKQELILETSNSENVTLKKFTDYVIPDAIINTIIEGGFENDIIRNDDFYNYFQDRLYKGQDLEGKTLITFRNGGIGDLIFQLPCLKYLKDKYPTCKIILSCNRQYYDLFSAVDYVDEIQDLPLELEMIEKTDYWTNFEGLIEGNPEAEIKNAYDLHKERFYITEDIDLCPQLKVDEEAERKMKVWLDQNHKTDKKILIAFSSSVAIRSVNPELYFNLIHTILNTYKNYKFFIVSTPNQNKDVEHFISQIKNEYRNKVINFSKKFDYKYQPLLALTKNVDVVISPDSGLLHIAGGLETPMVGLYGAFPSELRLKHYKNAFGIDCESTCPFARGEFKSCFQHGNGSCKLAIKYGEVYPPCMKIDVRNVIFGLQKLGLLK